MPLTLHLAIILYWRLRSRAGKGLQQVGNLQVLGGRGVGAKEYGAGLDGRAAAGTHIDSVRGAGGPAAEVMTAV